MPTVTDRPTPTRAAGAVLAIAALSPLTTAGITGVADHDAGRRLRAGQRRPPARQLALAAGAGLLAVALVLVLTLVVRAPSTTSTRPTTTEKVHA